MTLNENRLIPLGGEPLLNVAPNEFYTDLLEHYLISALHEIFYSSLAAENQSRLQHLEAALKYMDDETDKLQRKSQSYRQEEITEEIEVILLNSAVE
jgi:F-type H+-transporting ATPase subunit gamma